jgi:hypothetical protein
VTKVEPRRPGWAPRADAAAFLGVSVNYFDTEIRPFLGDSEVEKSGRFVGVFMPAAIRIWADRKRSTEIRKSPQKPSGEDADLWSDYDSPNLERLRAAKADQAEMDVAVRMGRLISVDDLKERMNWLFSRLRQYGDLLQRQFGRDAAIHHNEFMDDLKGFDVESIVSARSA